VVDSATRWRRYEWIGLEENFPGLKTKLNVGPPLVGGPIFEGNLRLGGERQPYTYWFRQFHSRT
jgi:hypothetical protein